LALLEVDDVTVRFGGVTAVSAASFEVDAGRIVGLMGPNGAGKTTLFNVITGLQEPTEGRVRFDGKDITEIAPRRRAQMGIGRTFQRLEVFGSLSVGDNIRVAAEMRAVRDRSADKPEHVRDRLLERVGLRAFADVPADAVPTGIARLTELARALACEPVMLLLDEPSSGLSEEETSAFADLVRSLAEDDGRSVLLVEHDVELVLGLCSTIHVLDFGQVIATGAPNEIQADSRVQDAYLGADTAAAEAADELVEVSS
jgi:branched-chain amino acid transport system ATP-binding protein